MRIMLNEIQLYKASTNIILPEPLGVFKISSPYITEKGIKFTAQLSGKIEILFIQGQMTSSTEQVPPIFGHVFIEAKSFRTPYNIEWTWGLLAQDISAIEAHRRENELQVCFSLNGIYKENEREIYSFFGSSLTTIALSEWYKVLDKYTIAHNAAIQVPQSLFNDQSWSTAADKLKNVNHLLWRGETRSALEECLSLIEGYVTNPYDRKEWDKCIDKDEHTQRRDGLISLFSGISTFLNKVGHHRSKHERDENDQLILMPLDHYEAEIMQLITHLVVVYLERLRASGTLEVDSNKSITKP